MNGSAMPLLPVETIRHKKTKKIVGYRVRFMLETKMITGPQRGTKSSARTAFTEQTLKRNAKPDPNLPTLSMQVKKLLEGRLKQEWEAKTVTLGWTVYNRTLSGIGKLQPAMIDEEAIIAERLRWNVSPSTAHRYQRMIERLLHLSGHKVKAAKPRLREPEIRILTMDEQRDFLNRIVQPRTRLAAEILLCWGLRNGEACGLKHEDRHENGVWLKRGIRDSGESYPMKTDRSRAWLPFFDDKLAGMIGPPCKGYVLATERGTAMLPSNLRRMMQSVAEHTPYEGLRPQDLRHTAAVTMLRSGIDVGTVASITRHSVDTLLKIYYRATPDAKIEAMKKLQAFRRSA